MAETKTALLVSLSILGKERQRKKSLGEIRVGTHTLRKTFGYHARKKGVDISILMEKFNHQSPSMTKRYIGITDDEISAVENGVNL